MPLYIVEKLVTGVLLIDLRGRITLGEDTSALREKVKQLLEAGHSQIVMDLGEVTYIDSAGLSTLVSSYTSARKRGGDVKLLRLTARVRDLLQITRLSTVFEVFDTFDEARKSFSRKPAPEARGLGKSSLQPNSGESR